jgi:signal transduction histidine kinase
VTSSLSLDLFSVGIAVAAIGILGFAIFLNNRKSATNRAFLLFSIVSVLWSVVNYAQYQTHTPWVSLLILRTVLFLGVWHSFSFFQFAYVFPKEKQQFKPWFKYLYVPLAVFASYFTLLTQFVFSEITETDVNGAITRVANGPLIPFIALLILFSVIGGIVLLIWKTVKAPREQKKQFSFVLWGMFATFALLMAFNFLLPAFFNTPGFIPLGAVFLLPFVAATFYAITRYHLLNMKVISTEVLAFILSAATLLEIIISGSVLELTMRIGIFVFVLVFSFFLISSVRHEVEQREELQVLNVKLDAANKQLDELSHFKSQLLSLASHQIRSPLAAIKGFISLILDGSYGPVDDKAKEALGKVGRSADELIALINTLLDVRKVEEGRMEYQFAKTDLTKIVSDVVGLMRPVAEAKKLEFTFTPPGREIFVNADGEKFKQVVQNLVDNAIKYTPAGFVRVELKEDPAQDPKQWRTATVSVSDSGLGIAAELIPHLFEEFIRDERVKKEVRGTGLGLFIARKITESHGGKIWAESGGEGKGSVFNVSLPEVK